MDQDAVFQRSRSQDVRLSKAVALPTDVSRAVGHARMVESWDSWFDGEGVMDDSMVLRDQPGQQERERFDVELPGRYQYLRR
ncbi:AbrB/MazE/SpoVT family DNA-binding domain-containing protein [Pseudomonas putida]